MIRKIRNGFATELIIIGVAVRIRSIFSVISLSLALTVIGYYAVFLFKIQVDTDLVEDIAAPGESPWRAALESGSAGATTSSVYNVLVYNEYYPSEKKNVFRADHVDNMDIYWKSEDVLIICEDGARIFLYSNFYTTEVKGETISLNVSLKPYRDCVGADKAEGKPAP